MHYNFATESFHIKKLCSRLSLRKAQIFIQKSNTKHVDEKANVKQIFFEPTPQYWERLSLPHSPRVTALHVTKVYDWWSELFWHGTAWGKIYGCWAQIVIVLYAAIILRCLSCCQCGWSELLWRVTASNYSRRYSTTTSLDIVLLTSVLLTHVTVCLWLIVSIQFDTYILCD